MTDERTLDGKAGTFLDLHRGRSPLLQPNAWDIGSARILAAMGFDAIATTSSGFAATLGRGDGQVSREEALDHCRALSGAVDIPVAADLEDCFAAEPDGVADTVRLAAQSGLAGCSIEDYTRDDDAPIYEVERAADRVRARVEAAHAGPTHLVITARAENLLHGVDDLEATIARLQTYQEAGADVLFAPGVRTLEQVQAIVSSVDRPLNVLVGPAPQRARGAGQPQCRAAGVSRRRVNLRRWVVRVRRLRRHGRGCVTTARAGHCHLSRVAARDQEALRSGVQGLTALRARRPANSARVAALLPGADERPGEHERSEEKARTEDVEQHSAMIGRGGPPAHRPIGGTLVGRHSGTCA